MSRDLPTKLGKRIRELRESARMTQLQLGDLTGKSPETISNLERGRTMPSVAALEMFADRLGVPLHEMFNFGRPAKPDALVGVAGKLELLTKGDRELIDGFIDVMLEKRAKR